MAHILSKGIPIRISESSSYKVAIKVATAAISRPMMSVFRTWIYVLGRRRIKSFVNVQKVKKKIFFFYFFFCAGGFFLVLYTHTHKKLSIFCVQKKKKGREKGNTAEKINSKVSVEEKGKNLNRVEEHITAIERWVGGVWTYTVSSHSLHPPEIKWKLRRRFIFCTRRWIIVTLFRIL